MANDTNKNEEDLLQNAKEEKDNGGEVRYVLNILDPENLGKMNKNRVIYDPDSVKKAIREWAKKNSKEIYTMDEIIERSREIAEEEMIEKGISIQIENCMDGMTDEQREKFMERWKEYERVLKIPGMMSMKNNNDDDGGNGEMGALNNYEMEELEDRMNELKRVKDEYDKCDWLMDYEENAIGGGGGGKSRLEKELGMFLDQWEMFRGLKNETKNKIKGLIYDVIKETRDDDGKVLKRYLYGFNKSKMMDVKRNDD